MTRGKKLFKSAFYGQLTIVMQFVSGFILMPQLIKYFGDVKFGLWILAGTILGYAGLLDLGFSKAILRYVSRAIGRNDYDECNKWITVGVFFLSISCIVGIALLFPITWYLKYISINDYELVRDVILIGGFSFLVALPSKAFMGILQAHVRGDVLEKINVGVGFVRIAILLLAIKFSQPFMYFIYILAISNVIQAVLIVVFAIRIHKVLLFSLESITLKNIKFFADYSGFSFLSQLADVFRFQAYPVIITSFLGLAAISQFEVANRIRKLLGLFHNKILINLTAVFSQIDGEDESEILRERYLFSYKIAIYLVVFTILIVAIIADDFINLWMGSGYEEAIELLLIGLIANFFAGIQIPGVCYLFGTSKHRSYALSNGLEAFLIVITALILVDMYGLVGMVLGASLSTFFVKTFIQPIWILRGLGIKKIDFYFKNTFISILKASLIFLGLYILSFYLLTPSYLSIGFYVFISAVIYSGYLFLIGFSPAERTALLNSFLKKN